jgi:hypothetical protein
MNGDLLEYEIAAVIEGSCAVGPGWSHSIDEDVQSYAEPAVANTMPRVR